MDCSHKETKGNGLCKSCGYNTRGLTNKELKKASSPARSKALEKGKSDFEKWRSSRSGTHSKKISKKLGIPLHED